MSIFSAEGIMPVAIDADGVIVDFASGVVDFAWRTRKIRYHPEQIHPNPVEEPIPELDAIIAELLDRPEEVERLRLFPNTAEGLHILCEEGYDPQIISVRNELILGQATRNWAEIHNLSRYLSRFHLSDGWTEAANFKIPKALDLKVVAAFEDADHVAYRYALAGIPTFHIRNPIPAPPSFPTNCLLLTQHPTFIEGVQAFVRQPTKTYIIL